MAVLLALPMIFGLSLIEPRAFSAHITQAVRSVDLRGKLPGRYEYLNVMELLRFPFDPSLNIICPPEITVLATSDSKRFEMQIGSGSNAPDVFQCFINGGVNVSTILEEVNAIAGSSSPAAGDGIATQADLENYYPTFFGNFSNHPLICPVLDVPIQPTNITVRDTAYLHTILNHYKTARLPVGDTFEFINASAFEPIQETYSIGITIIPDILGCSYLPPHERSRLLERVEEILASLPYFSPGLGEGNATNMNTNETLLPSPSPSPSSMTSSEGPTCFPEDAFVRLLNGSVIAIKHLKVGDIIQDGPGSYSKVLLFTHADSNVRSLFVRIRTNHTELALTPSHYLYVNERLMPAAKANVGDEITVITENGQKGQDVITEIGVTYLKGIYNPNTASGDIAVAWKGNAVITSAYTTAVNPKLAHSLSAPLRVLDRTFGLAIPLLSYPFHRGSSFWPIFGGATSFVRQISGSQLTGH